MRFDSDQLDTLLTITEQGTFEAAARRLHLTPSAVSQRIRTLEKIAGQVLVQRSTPAVATVAGEPLVRLARQLRLLNVEAASTLEGNNVIDLSVAVNADSLATWFRPVFDAIAARAQTALRLHVEDQTLSHDLLRRGEVLAAVTSEPQPAQGCVSEPLGALRYTPAAAPDLLKHYRHGRSVDWSAMPMVVYNEKDQLQDSVLTAHGATRPPVIHRVPSTADFREAIRRGLGWGMLLDAQLGADVAKLPGTRPIDVPLFWQRWRLDSGALAALTDDVREAAKVLRRPHAPHAPPPMGS